MSSYTWDTSYSDSGGTAVAVGTGPVLGGDSLDSLSNIWTLRPAYCYNVHDTKEVTKYVCCFFFCVNTTSFYYGLFLYKFP